MSLSQVQSCVYSVMLRPFAASLIASGGEYALFFLVSSFLAFSAPHQQTACGLGHYCYEVEEWDLKKERWLSSYFIEETNASFLFFVGAVSYMMGLWP